LLSFFSLSFRFFKAFKLYLTGRFLDLFYLTFGLIQKLQKIKACVGYLAPDGKASTAHIGAVSLPQSAWILHNEQRCKCFAARCVGILQGRFSRAQDYSTGLKLISRVKSRSLPFC
ncbi:MAG: hypothetical protein M5Z89_09140, partial [Olivibacter sp.]|nr:hypothetical protein [Olivibacter sp. UJ_SKK_5.1]